MIFNCKLDIANFKLQIERPYAMCYLIPYFAFRTVYRCQRRPGSPFAFLATAEVGAAANQTRAAAVLRLICNLQSIRSGPLDHARASTVSKQTSASNRRNAFSILEVILALAILAGAAAVLGELARLGLRNAKLAQDLTRAQFLCQSKMAEFTSGITIPQSVSGAAFDSIDQNSDIPWLYSVELEQIDQDGLIALRVTVSQNLPATQRPASFTLVRWMPDPTITQSTDSTQESGSSGSTTGNSNAQ